MRRQPEEKTSPGLRRDEVVLQDFQGSLKIFQRSWTGRKEDDYLDASAAPHPPALTPQGRTVGSELHLLRKWQMTPFSTRAVAAMDTRMGLQEQGLALGSQMPPRLVT